MGLGRWVLRAFGGHLSELEEVRRLQDEASRLVLPLEHEFGGKTVRLRQMEAADFDRVLEFARALPEHDLLFLRRDITQAAEVAAWVADVAEGRYASIVAIEGDRLIGYATVAQDGMTWTRHVGELRILVAPEMRGLGLGSLLLEQAFAAATSRGIRKLVAQMTIDQQRAIRGFARLGFTREAILKRHVIDREGGLHDLQIMALDLAEFDSRLMQGRLAVMASAETQSHPL